MHIIDPTGKLLGWFFGKTMVSQDGRTVRLLRLDPGGAELPTDIIAQGVLDLPLVVIPFYRAERTELLPRPEAKQFTQRSYCVAKTLPEDFWTLWDAVELTEGMLKPHGVEP